MSALPDLSRFDDVEVMPSREDRHESYCAPPDAPHTASFWTVYGRLREGGVEALIDCDDEHSADIAAAILRAALALPELMAAAETFIRNWDAAVKPWTPDSNRIRTARAALATARAMTGENAGTP